MQLEEEDYPHLIDYNEDQDDYIEESPTKEHITQTKSQKNLNINKEKILDLKVSLGSNSIKLDKEKSTKIPILVSISETQIDEEKTEDASIDLICLIDCSGSMDGHKLAEVQKSLIYMVELMSENDRMALVSFNSEATVLNSLRICTLENKRGRLRTNITDLRAMGGTNIVGGLNKALKILAKRDTKNQVASVFLLSDGNDNYEMEGLDYVLKSFEEKIGNFSIHTFGYGEDHNPDLMTKLAQKKEGSFYYIQDLKRVDEAFIDCLALLKSSIGFRAQAKVSLIPSRIYQELRFEATFGLHWKGESEITRNIEIGDLYIGMQKNYIANLEFNKVSKPENYDKEDLSIQPIATVDIIITELSTGEKINISDTVVIDIWGEDDQREVEENEEVEKQLMRVKGAEIMEEARKFIDQDKLEEAKSAFNSFKVRLNKFKTLDNVIENLNYDFDMMNHFIEKPQIMTKTKKRNYQHQMAQRAFNYHNECSNPIWNRNSLYENKKQKKMKNMLYHLKY